MKQGRWLTGILWLIVILLVTGCGSQYSNPPPTLQESDLIGVWEANYMEVGSDRLVLRDDGTFQQIYHDGYVAEYVYETGWNEWRVERFPDGRVQIHLQGARYYRSGIPIAELDGMFDPCPIELPDCTWEPVAFPFYDPIAGAAISMPRKLVLNVQSDSSGNLVLLHMLLDSDEGSVSLTGKATGFERVGIAPAQLKLPTP